jgi:hypothetical protein
MQIHLGVSPEVVRKIRSDVTRKVCENSQGRFVEPPLGDEGNRHIHFWSLLTTRYWLEGETCKALTDTVYDWGEDASRSLCSEFIDGVPVRVARIHHKQIACEVKGQTLCAVRHRPKHRSRIPA